MVVLNQVNARLVDGYGASLAVPDGYALVASNLGVLAAGSDGSQAQFLRVGTDGTVRVDPIGTTAQPVVQQASTAVRTSVAASLTSVQLLAANSIRKGAKFFNDSDSGVLFIGYGSAVSTSDFSFKLGAGGMSELTVPIFTGSVHGIWSVADGSARITELT